MNADKMRRGSMWVLASGVAAIAAIVSYSHIYDLGIEHGGSGLPARLLPLSVDMLILVGELMLLHEADAKGKRFTLAWVLVWSGILATLAANVAYGYQFGALGAVIWGWPAYSFILAAGGMVTVVKRGVSRRVSVAPETTVQGADETVQDPKPEIPEVTGEELEFPQVNGFPSLIPTDAEKAAETAMRATVAAGNPLTLNQLSSRFKLTRSEATRVRSRVLAEANGHRPEELADSAVS